MTVPANAHVWYPPGIDVRWMLFPYGYKTLLVTYDELWRLVAPNMHPEQCKRLFHWLALQGGKVGVGGHFRYVQPDKYGFAPDGKSFHQFQDFKSGLRAYCAVDLVVVNESSWFKRLFSFNGSAADPDYSKLKAALTVSRVHRAPYWSEVPAQGSYASIYLGVHCNVNGEPWHMQPVEIDGWLSWVNAGRPDPAAGYLFAPGRPLANATVTPPVAPAPVAPAPVAPAPVAPAPVAPAPVAPAPVAPPPPTPNWTEKIVQTLPTTKKGATGFHARMVQSLLVAHGHQITIDGNFGPQTDSHVRWFQGERGLTTDGIVGPNTWQRLLTPGK